MGGQHFIGFAGRGAKSAKEQLRAQREFVSAQQFFRQFRSIPQTKAFL
jgi:hypothetical protein